MTTDKVFTRILLVVSLFWEWFDSLIMMNHL